MKRFAALLLLPFLAAPVQAYDYLMYEGVSLEKTPDADGCFAPQRMVFVDKRPIGCMTEAELNRWNIEQQNKRRPAFVPPVPTYQPAPTVRTCTGHYGTYTCY